MRVTILCHTINIMVIKLLAIIMDVMRRDELEEKRREENETK